jgi:hypothetical protein
MASYPLLHPIIERSSSACEALHTRLPTLLDMNCRMTSSLIPFSPDLCLGFTPFSFSRSVPSVLPGNGIIEGLEILVWFWSLKQDTIEDFEEHNRRGD